jgi:phosphatidylserine decarboxylase
MGYFEFGGSSTILLFEPGKITLSNDLIEWTNQSTELYAKMGDVAGKAI